MKIFKRLVAVVVGLTLLLVVGAVLAVQLIDLDDYRPRIEQAVEQHTGRAATVGGGISLTFYPWAGLKLGQIELANAPGFGDRPFARLNGAQVKVELLPLLSRRINVSRIEIDDVSLDLQRRTDGSTNWEDLVPETADQNRAGTEGGTDPEPVEIASFSIDGIDISNSTVNWRDQQTGTEVTLDRFDLSTGPIRQGEPFYFQSSFNLDSRSAGVKTAVSIAGQLLADLGRQRHRIDGLNLQMDVAGAALPAGRQSIHLKSDVVADVSTQRVQLNAMDLKLGELTLKGEVELDDFSTSPRIQAELSSNSFDPGSLFDQLGMAKPETVDPAALSRASVSMTLNGTPASLTLHPFRVVLDQSTINGRIELPDITAAMPPVIFDLSIDEMDIDRYIVGGNSDDIGEKSQAKAGISGDFAGDESLDLPVEALRELSVDGKLSVDRLRINRMNLKQVAAEVSAGGGLLRIDKLTSQLYDGDLKATNQLDVRQSRPRISSKIYLSHVDADALLGDLMQQQAPVSGTVSVSLDLSSQGNTVAALRSALAGTVDTEIRDGAVRGLNVAYQLRRARAALKGQQLSKSDKLLETDFSSLSVSGNIADGVLHSDDLDLRSPLLRLRGSGDIDLAQSYLDYRPTLLITGTAEGQGGKELKDLKGIPLSLLVQGYFSDLGADFTESLLDSLKASLTDIASKRARAEADRLKQQAQQRLDAKKARLKQQAEEKLAAEKAALQKKAQKQSEELKDKAKDRLKGALNDLLQ